MNFYFVLYQSCLNGSIHSRYETCANTLTSLHAVCCWAVCTLAHNCASVSSDTPFLHDVRWNKALKTYDRDAQTKCVNEINKLANDAETIEFLTQASVMNHQYLQ